MDPDIIRGVLVADAIICGMLGAFVAATCGRGLIEGVVHGAILGPFGLILLALYPRPGNEGASEAVDRKTANQLLADIHAELKWQREQKEKEIVRAKAAQSNKPSS